MDELIIKSKFIVSTPVLLNIQLRKAPRRMTDPHQKTIQEIEREHRLVQWIEEQARQYMLPNHGCLERWQVEMLETLPNWREYVRNLSD
jgi:hypothetical protein